MSRSRFVLPALSISAVLLSILVAHVPRCLAEVPSCIIELANGGTLSANSCRVEGDRLILGYPVGDAAIPISSVKSVKTGDKEVLSLLQEKGEYVPPSADDTNQAAGDLTPETRPGGLAGPVQSLNTPGAKPGQTTTPGAVIPPDNATANSVDSGATSVFILRDPKADKFLNDFFSGRMTDEEIDREMDALFVSVDNEPDDDEQTQ